MEATDLRTEFTKETKTRFNSEWLAYNDYVAWLEQRLVTTVNNFTNRTYSVDEVKILLEKQKQACANEFIHGEMSMELAKRKVLQTPIVSF
jgi:hypothetical protein